MILVADSGSTKTDWALVDEQGLIVKRMTTEGFNPIMMDAPSVPELGDAWSGGQVFFYGAGCTQEQAPRVYELLLRLVPDVTHCDVHSDLLGAAHAVCGHEEGVACILGTGANSCLYDGRRIVQNTPALGYVLGDEGSGAVLGRKFINALYKGRLPLELKENFEEETGLTMMGIIGKVYREPMANRFLASTSLFIGKHLDVPELRQLVVDNFREFLRHNVAPYKRRDLSVGFVGSMAHHYENELREAAGLEQFTVGLVMRSPIEGIVRFLR